jgi:hypothetical protein
MSKRTSKPTLPRVKKPPPLPSIDELIAEARALGEDDMANAFEKIRYLESPKGQRSLERRERRISRR